MDGHGLAIGVGLKLDAVAIEFIDAFVAHEFGDLFSVATEVIEVEGLADEWVIIEGKVYFADELLMEVAQQAWS
jgi:hypothetical protein